MKNFKLIHKLIFAFFMLVTFIILIQWTVQFEFFKVEDMKLFVILILGTMILILLGTNDLSDWVELSNKFRFNLFLTGMLMSLMLIFNLFGVKISEVQISSMILCLKPMILCLVIYLPVMNVLNRLMVKQNEKKEPDLSDLRTLSRRETEVYEMAIQGFNNKEISVKLYIAESTVKKHMQNILKKTSCDDRHMLINKYEMNG